MEKKLLNNVIRVLDDLPPKGRVYRRTQGEKLLGNSAAWDEVHEWISNNVSHNIINPGSTELVVWNPEGVAMVRERIFKLIENIEKTEYIADLKVKESKSNIFTNRHTVIVSYLALVISILATTPLPKDLYKWIGRLIFGE